ncbi:MAG: hypothetical protein RCG15_04480 [Candidatus Rickettsia vulgarisii]
MQNKKLNILIFYDDHACYTSTVTEHLDSFRKYSKHNIFHAIGTLNAFCGTNINFADVIIIHYSVRVAHSDYISSYLKKELSNFKGLKCLFIQDEYENTYQAHHWIKKLGINTVFTCVPEKFINDVYPKSIFPNVKFINNLTGYVPEDISDLNILPHEERKNLIVYRGRKLGYWYGSLGQEKYEIGIKMNEICQKLQIPADIECDDKKRIYGSAWYDFLTNSRAILGTESGANIFDFDGTLKTSIEKYLKRKPNATYDEVAKIFLKDDGKILMNQISPKIFQSIICRTALILYEGEYSGIIEPYRHYIPLKKDWSNINEVLEQVNNLDHIKQLTENAYNDIIKSGKYNYQAFVKMVEKEIDKYSLTQKQIPITSIPITPNNNLIFLKSYISSHYTNDRAEPIVIIIKLNYFLNKISTIKSALRRYIVRKIPILKKLKRILCKEKY